MAVCYDSYIYEPERCERVMTKKIIGLLLIVALGVGVLAGCNSGTNTNTAGETGDNPPSANDKVTIEGSWALEDSNSVLNGMVLTVLKEDDHFTGVIVELPETAAQYGLTVGDRKWENITETSSLGDREYIAYELQDVTVDENQNISTTAMDFTFNVENEDELILTSSKDRTVMQRYTRVRTVEPEVIYPSKVTPADQGAGEVYSEINDTIDKVEEHKNEIEGIIDHIVDVVVSW